MLNVVESHLLEGIVAKCADSIYEPALRTGLWRKQRMNRSQAFVVGGYIPGSLGVDSLVSEVYQGKDLHYVARVRAGFVPAMRREVSEQLARLITMDCPFVNLAETEPRRWGQGSSRREDAGMRMGQGSDHGGG